MFQMLGVEEGPNLHLKVNSTNFTQWLSCIVGNVAAGFEAEEECMELKRRLYLVIV